MASCIFVCSPVYFVLFIEIEQLRKNKSFIAKKAETHEQEKQIHDSAPIEKVNIIKFPHLQLCLRTWCPLDHTLRHP